MSHLLQMRGLKPFYASQRIELARVASFTDAWIETKFAKTPKALYAVASFTDAWIETFTLGSWVLVSVSHLLQMRGLKHPLNVTLPTRK